jgi:hypothetical protein
MIEMMWGKISAQATEMKMEEYRKECVNRFSERIKYKRLLGLRLHRTMIDRGSYHKSYACSCNFSDCSAIAIHSGSKSFGQVCSRRGKVVK